MIGLCTISTLLVASIFADADSASTAFTRNVAPPSLFGIRGGGLFGGGDKDEKKVRYV